MPCPRTYVCTIILRYFKCNIGAAALVISAVSSPSPLTNTYAPYCQLKLNCDEPTLARIGPIFYNNTLPAAFITPKNLLQNPCKLGELVLLTAKIKVATVLTSVVPLVKKLLYLLES